MQRLYSDDRMAILTAVQKGILEQVRFLLLKNHELIHARTTTAGSSLLHIAAERGHVDICQLLLDQRHDTNPVDNKGKTPYQRTQSQEIKEKLVKYHFDLLCQKYYTAKFAEMPPKEYIGSLTVETKVMHGKELFDLMQSKNVDAGLAQNIFGVTFLKNAETNLQQVQNYHITTIFREDIIMTPYYGNLLIIHENQQAMSNLEFLATIDEAFNPATLMETGMDMCFEARAYMALITKGLELFPFLSDYPKQNDSPDIIEAKKMFIGFGLYGFYTYLNKCKENDYLDLLYSYNEHSVAISFLENKYISENQMRNQEIIKEVHEKYACNNLDLLSCKKSSGKKI